MTFLTALFALPLGDDTPIMLYAILAVVAVAALVAVTLMGKKNGGKNNRRKK